MAQDGIDKALELGELERRPSRTEQLKVHGYTTAPLNGHLASYGSDAVQIEALMQSDNALAQRLHPAYPMLQPK